MGGSAGFVLTHDFMEQLDLISDVNRSHRLLGTKKINPYYNNNKNDRVGLSLRGSYNTPTPRFELVW